MGKPKDNIAIAAAFLAGFHRMMTLLLNLNGSFLTLMRFGISPSKIGCFIGDTGSCMQFWNNWGILLSFGLTFCGWIGNKQWIAPGFCTIIYSLAFFYACYVKRFIWWKALFLFICVLGPIVGILFVLAASADGEYAKFVCPAVSIFSSIGVFIAYCMLAFVCLSSHGYEGVRKLFFWLCASAFAYQFDQCMVTKVNGTQAAWFFLALELYGPLLPLLHWLAGMFAKCFGFDVESCKLLWQIGMMILFTYYGLMVWCVNAVIQIIGAQSKTADKDAGKSLKRCLSPGFIGAIGLGSIFWLFPVVWPFMVCHFSHFQTVMFFCPILGALATLIPWALGDGDKIHEKFGGNLKTKFDNWNYEGGKANCYHSTWCLLVFIVILCWIITCCVHYPRCFVARSVLHSRWAVFYGSLLYFLTQLFKAFGLTGVFANAIGCLLFPSGFSIDPTAGIALKDDSGGSGIVKIGESSKVEFPHLEFSTANEDFMAVDYPSRLISGSATTSGTASDLKVQLFGLVGGKPVETKPFPATGSPTAFNVTTSILRLSGMSLTLGVNNATDGANEASGITNLKYFEVKNLEITNLEIDGSAESSVSITNFKWTEAAGIPGETVGASKTFSLATKTLNGNVSATAGSGKISATIQTGVVSITSSGHDVTIQSLTFSSFVVVFAGKRLSGSNIQLDKDTSGAKVKLSDDDQGSTGNTTSDINASSFTAANLKVGNDNIVMSASTADAKLGGDKFTGAASDVGSFVPVDGQNFTAQDLLTKAVITVPLTASDTLKIDGIPVGDKMIVTLALRDSGAKGTGAKTFEIGDTSNKLSNSHMNTAPFVGSSISFPALPPDFVHGPTFGNVFVDFALFHMTATFFTTQAYSVGYSSFKCAVNSGCSWPTQGIGGFRSFFWWLGYGLKNGNRRFRGLADVDIISVIS